MERLPSPSGGLATSPRTRGPRLRHVVVRLAPMMAPLVALAAVAAACNAGPTGPAGSTGPAGNSVPAAVTPTFNAATCTQPCHGFEDSIVAQWQTSKHFAASALAAQAPVLDNGRACGNCHAIDGLQRRLAGQVSTVGDAGASDLNLGHLNYQPPDAGITQVGYSGSATLSQIHCVACHAFTDENNPHLTGYFQQVPLVVPFGDERMLVETSPSRDAGIVGTPTVASYGAGNACIMCHKSTMDNTFAISQVAPTAITPYWGPHEGAQAEIFTGIGPITFAGQTYDSSLHAAIPTGCVRCHMAPMGDDNNYPDHSFLPRTSTCTFSACHGPTSTFDIAVAPHTVGGQTTATALILALRTALCDPNDPTYTTTVPVLASKCYLTQDPQSATPASPLSATAVADITTAAGDIARFTKPPRVLQPPVASALYNYILAAKSRDRGVHNPIFMQQILWDSIVAVTGNPPANIPGLTGRPTALPKPQ